MANMAYCRFQNTVSDLNDCYMALTENNDPFEGMSQQERVAAKRLIRLCGEIYNEFKDSE